MKRTCGHGYAERQGKPGPRRETADGGGREEGKDLRKQKDLRERGKRRRQGNQAGTLPKETRERKRAY